MNNTETSMESDLIGKKINFNKGKEEPKNLMVPISLFDKKVGEYLFVYNLEINELSIQKIASIDISGDSLYLVLENNYYDSILFVRPHGKSIPLIHTKIRVIATSTKEIEDWYYKYYKKKIKL